MESVIRPGIHRFHMRSLQRAFLSNKCGYPSAIDLSKPLIFLFLLYPQLFPNYHILTKPIIP
jgi:hypothetical protein